MATKSSSPSSRSKAQPVHIPKKATVSTGGALIGAAVGGPIGAVIGGMIGLGLGAAADQSPAKSSQEEKAPASRGNLTKKKTKALGKSVRKKAFNKTKAVVHKTAAKKKAVVKTMKKTIKPSANKK